MQLADDVITELSRATISSDGRSVKLGSQLARKLYLECNEVLETLGGKWHKGQKTHVFSRDARGPLEAAILSGSVVTDAGLGFFETPEDLARGLVRSLDVRRGDWCLEPSAGKGRLVSELFEAGAGGVTVVERHADRLRHLEQRFGRRHGFTIHGAVDDFMQFECTEPFDCVAMNPPFVKVGLGDHLDHVRHAFGMLAPGGRLAAILPTGVRFREDRRHTAFREWINSLGGTLENLPDDAFKASGTRVRTCLLHLREG